MSKSPKENSHKQMSLTSAPTTLTNLSRGYADSYSLRAAIQAIPGLGGSLDTMLAGLGARWQMERFEAFISSLDRRLTAVEGPGRVPALEPSEPLYDFIMEAIEKTIRTRSIEKREAFAAIVERQVRNPGTWDEAESALKLIGDLSELQLEILLLAMKTEPCAPPFEGLRVVAFQRLENGPMVVLPEHFSATPLNALRLACADLVAKGLLRDVGVGRLSMASVTHFALTDEAQWLLDWLRNQPESSFPRRPVS
jgi:hypothetical protein